MKTEKLISIVELYCTVTAVTNGTKRLHLICLTHFERFLERPALVSDLNDVTYSRFVAYRQQRVAVETVRGECNKLLALWRWCAGGNRRWIDPPEVKAPEPQWRLPKALDREQLERLWRVVKVYPRLVGTLPGNVVLTAFLYVLWDSAERISAAYHIERDNIDLKRGWVMVEPETRKGGKRGRLYKLRPATVVALQRLMDIYAGPRPFAECSLMNYYKHWPYLRAAADLPKWATFHTIRKSHASHLVALGGDARLSLGHSSDAITNRHYIDARIAQGAKQPSELLFDPGRKKWLW